MKLFEQQRNQHDELNIQRINNGTQTPTTTHLNTTNISQTKSLTYSKQAMDQMIHQYLQQLQHPTNYPTHQHNQEKFTNITQPPTSQPTNSLSNRKTLPTKIRNLDSTLKTNLSNFERMNDRFNSYYRCMDFRHRNSNILLKMHKTLSITYLTMILTSRKSYSTQMKKHHTSCGLNTLHYLQNEYKKRIQTASSTATIDLQRIKFTSGSFDNYNAQNDAIIYKLESRGCFTVR